MPQMSPMSWTMLSFVYLSMILFLFSKMSKISKETKASKSNKISVMKMEW